MQVFDSRVELSWGDGEHVFKLALAQVRELQERCKAGPAEIAERLQSSRWFVDDIRETLRLGLIGGGKTPVEALTLVKRYVDERPLAENIIVANVLIMSVLYGVADDPVGKKEEAEGAATETAVSPSPRSTERAPQSV